MLHNIKVIFFMLLITLVINVLFMYMDRILNVQPRFATLDLKTIVYEKAKVLAENSNNVTDDDIGVLSKKIEMTVNQIAEQNRLIFVSPDVIFAGVPDYTEAVKNAI